MQPYSPPDPGVRRNVLILALAHGVLGAQVAMHVIVGGLVGILLAPDASLATLPISMALISSALCTGPVSALMGRLGRRAGFLLGAVAGAAAGLVAAAAIAEGSFTLFLVGAFLVGVYQATQGYYRFAAADITSGAFRPRAISWVLAGGLGAALLGPELVQQTRSLVPDLPYAGAYLAITAVNLVGSLLFVFLRLPPPPPRQKGGGRPLAAILRDRPIVVAMLCAMISYASMNLVMTATPLAMVHAGSTPDTAADVVRWHIVAMFGPSFFTGHLVARFGHVRIIGSGLLLFLAASAIALAGAGLANYYAALILLGLAWNFGYVGATSLLAASHPPGERTLVQGMNDTLVFVAVVVASFASGALLDQAGWDAVQYSVLPGVAIAAIGLVLLVRTAPEGAWRRI